MLNKTKLVSSQVEILLKSKCIPYILSNMPFPKKFTIDPPMWNVREGDMLHLHMRPNSLRQKPVYELEDFQRYSEGITKQLKV